MLINQKNKTDKEIIIKDYIFHIEKRKFLNISFKNYSKHNVTLGQEAVRFTISAGEINKGKTDWNITGQCQLKIFKDLPELHKKIKVLDNFHLKQWSGLSEAEQSKVIEITRYLMKNFDFIESVSSEIEDDFGIRFHDIISFYNLKTK